MREREAQQVIIVHLHTIRTHPNKNCWLWCLDRDSLSIARWLVIVMTATTGRSIGEVRTWMSGSEPVHSSKCSENRLRFFPAPLPKHTPCFGGCGWRINCYWGVSFVCENERLGFIGHLCLCVHECPLSFDRVGRECLIHVSEEIKPIHITALS